MAYERGELLRRIPGFEDVELPEEETELDENGMPLDCHHWFSDETYSVCIHCGEPRD